MVTKKKVAKKKVAKKKLPPHRPRTVSDEQIKEAIKLTATGMPLTQACRDLKLVYQTVLDRILRSDELSELDTRARKSYLQNSVRSMNQLTDNEEDVQRARLKCDNIKWEASRVCRKIYGDKSEVDMKVGVAPMNKKDMKAWLEKFGDSAI